MPLPSPSGVMSRIDTMITFTYLVPLDCYIYITHLLGE